MLFQLLDWSSDPPTGWEGFKKAGSGQRDVWCIPLKEICKICRKIFHRTIFEIVFRVNEEAVVDLTFDYSVSIHKPNFCAQIMLFSASSKFIWLFFPKFSKVTTRFSPKSSKFWFYAVHWRGGCIVFTSSGISHKGVPAKAAIRSWRQLPLA